MKLQTKTFEHEWNLKFNFDSLMLFVTNVSEIVQSEASHNMPQDRRLPLIISEILELVWVKTKLQGVTLVLFF